MADINPFRPYRYSPEAGTLQLLATQPYDKISPEMRTRYESLSPYNFVRIILGDHRHAAQYLNEWMDRGILVQDREPGLYAYFQEFDAPDSGARFLRKGFIGLGPVVDYSDHIVYRHEQTLSGPKKDRLELLKQTQAHCEQIFMLYADPEFAIDALVERAADGKPLAEVTDEYGATHRLWRIGDSEPIRRLMLDKKLLIADGHHRYETALAFGSRDMMMTFFNMHSPGVKILATHRVVSGLPGVDLSAIPTRTIGSLAELKQLFAQPSPDRIRIGIALPGTTEIRLMERDRRPGELDVHVLHRELLGDALGISEEAVREEKYLRYERGLDAACSKLADGEAQAVFLLEPTTIEQVAQVAFSGGVMPQKSTDFFPKLLSGLTVYKW